ncbi:MAG: DUF928 domain-containing protein [Leptolyngbya sp. BL-A-14]
MTSPPSHNVSPTKRTIYPQFQLAKREDTKLKQSVPPPRKNPGGSSAGGRRAPSACPQDTSALATNSELVALTPKTQPDSTLAARPTFFVYVPKTSAKTAEFSLRDRKGMGVYRTTLALTKTPAIVRLSLPDQTPSLDVNQQYVWSFAVICNPNDRLDDRFVSGTVQRITIDSVRLRQIQQASPREQVSLYQQAGLWYDALAVVYELQRAYPNDASINTTWQEFLRSSGVDSLMDNKSSQKSLR